MPKVIQPMLATLVDEPFDSDEWAFETKWDGVRALAFWQGGELKLISRNQNDLTPAFPELSRATGAIKADTAIFDGEIVSLDEQGRSSFQALQPRLGLADSSAAARLAAEAPAVYFIFDLLYLDGNDLTELPLSERRRLLAETIPAESAALRLSDYIVGQGVKLFDLAKARGLEGIIAKKLSRPYLQKRSRDWQKIKVVQTQDCVVCGFTESRGTREYFGALILGVYEDGRLTYAGHTGTGFDAATLAALYQKMAPLVTNDCPFATVPHTNQPAKWLKPELVCQVRFSEWTTDGSLRHPVFDGLREDKTPAECVREAPGPPRPTLTHKGPAEEVTVDSRALKLTNLDKVFWPELALTKRDLIDYYYSVADLLLPHLRDRPMAMKRYPNGIHGDYFWQKDAPTELPAWVATAIIAEGEGDNRYILVNDKATLIYLANLACIDLNPWSSRAGSLENPDWLIIDLDPFETPFAAVAATALACRQVLGELGLKGYPKTSGATGMHILVPLEPVYTYAQIRKMAEIIAKLTLARAPDIATIEPEIRNRRGRVYLDWLQNIRGKTVASTYSPRPETGATVSTPLSWDEVRPELDPSAFTIKTVPERLRRLGDLFEPVLKDKQRLEEAIDKLG